MSSVSDTNLLLNEIRNKTGLSSEKLDFIVDAVETTNGILIQLQETLHGDLTQIYTNLDIFKEENDINLKSINTRLLSFQTENNFNLTSLNGNLVNFQSENNLNLINFRTQNDINLKSIDANLVSFRSQNDINLNTIDTNLHDFKIQNNSNLSAIQNELILINSVSQNINTNIQSFNVDNNKNLSTLHGDLVLINNELQNIHQDLNIGFNATISEVNEFRSETNNNFQVFYTNLHNLLQSNFNSLLTNQQQIITNQQQIIDRLPLSGFTDGITFTLTNSFSTETVIGAIGNLSVLTGARSYIQKFTANMISDVKPDRYRLYKGTVSNLTPPITWSQVNGGFVYYTNTPIVNFAGTKLVWDETVAASTSAIKENFTEIQLFLALNDILIITAENVSGNASQTCNAYVSWYDCIC